MYKTFRTGVSKCSVRFEVLLRLENGNGSYLTVINNPNNKPIMTKAYLVVYLDKIINLPIAIFPTISFLLGRYYANL